MYLHQNRQAARSWIDLLFSIQLHGFLTHFLSIITISFFYVRLSRNAIDQSNMMMPTFTGGLIYDKKNSSANI
jgi:hypothetical protein